MSEQLQMKRHQVDFLRNIVTARHTENGRPRDIPMNDDVRQALADLCKDKRPDDYIFVSDKTGSCIREPDMERSSGHVWHQTGRSRM